MRQSGQDVWWAATRRLGAGTIVGGLAALALPSVFDLVFGGRSLFGMPLAMALFVLVLPLALLALIFWFTRRQFGLDHTYDVTGDPN